MYTKTTTVTNAEGIHARPASTFVRAAGQWNSDIEITNLSNPEAGSANAKSIINVLTLGMAQGCQVSISATGEDEKEAVDALIALIDSGLGE